MPSGTAVMAATGDRDDYEMMLDRAMEGATPQVQLRHLYTLAEFDDAEFLGTDGGFGGCLVFGAVFGFAGCLVFLGTDVGFGGLADFFFCAVFFCGCGGAGEEVALILNWGADCVS